MPALLLRREENTMAGQNRRRGSEQEVTSSFSSPQNSEGKEVKVQQKLAQLDTLPNKFTSVPELKITLSPSSFI